VVMYAGGCSTSGPLFCSSPYNLNNLSFHVLPCFFVRASAFVAKEDGRDAAAWQQAH
jgi:hypothetical protein